MLNSITVKFWLLLIILGSIITISVYAADSDKEFLETAWKNTATIPYKAVDTWMPPVKRLTYIVHYQLPEPDGAFVNRRRDVYFPGRKDLDNPAAIDISDVLNKTGFYRHVARSSIKRPWDYHSWLPEKIPAEVQVSRTSWSANYRGKPCYKFKATYPSDFVLPAGADPEEWPHMTEYLIDKEHNFIYAWKQYNRKGKLISESEFGDVDFNVKPDPELFKTPSGKIKEIADNKEAAKVLYQDSAPKKPFRIDISFEWLWTYSKELSIVLAILGILVIGVVIVLKIKK